MAEIDELLRSVLKRVAHEGDSAGVAEAIRARVNAGDIGTPAATSGFSGGLMGWLPWLAVVMIAGIVGGTLGATGAFGRPVEVVTSSGLHGVLERTVDALDCPGGSRVGALTAGDRVLGILRSDDGGYISVRDPYDLGRTLWLPVSALTVDEGQADAASLPVGGCPVPVVVAPSAPEPPPGQSPASPSGPQPGSGTSPQPPADTAPPSMQQSWASPTQIYCPSNVGPSFPGSTTLHLLASDNVAVTSVSLAWSGAHAGSGSMSVAGGEWQYSYTMPAETGGTITFSMTAFDAAGNASSTSVGVNVGCLI